jgi:hypothetical protein
MFQLPSVITMSIAATRMHRSLTDFASSTTDVYDILLILASPGFTADENPQNGYSKISKLQWNETPSNRIEVTVDTSLYQMPQTSRHDLYITAESAETSYGKPHESEPQQRAGEIA